MKQSQGLEREGGPLPAQVLEEGLLNDEKLPAMQITGLAEGKANAKVLRCK
jgi:hypothetical protein